MKHVPLLTVGGLYYRAIRADRIDHIFDPPRAESAGRYHRLGQPALYFTGSPEWARISVSDYMREDGLPRLIVPIELDAARVIDQRDEAVCRLAGIDREESRAEWREALSAGDDPPSWRTSDIARTLGADGLIDPSRHLSDGWHTVLFRWNESCAPQVRIVGEPMPVVLPDGGDH